MEIQFGVSQKIYNGGQGKLGSIDFAISENDFTYKDD